MFTKDMKERAEHIPAEMKQKIQWTPTKGKKAFLPKWQEEENWVDFETALQQSSKGFPGFILTAPYFCLDLDRVINSKGKLSKGAQDFLTRVREIAGRTYTEFSSSGRGLHLFFKADIPQDYPKQLKKSLGDVVEASDKTGNILEVYTCNYGNGKGKYIAVTGFLADGNGTIADGTKLLPFLLDFFGKGISQQEESNANTPPADNMPPVDEIPALIRNSKSGELFTRLFDNGDISAYGNDESSADMALMNLLPFWTGGNADKMEQVFSLSKLAERDKWQNRPDYRKRTIQAALKTWDGKSYSPEYYHTSPDDDFKASDETPIEGDVIPFPVWPVVNTSRKTRPPITVAWQNTAYLLKRLDISCKYNILTKEIEVKGHGTEKVGTDTALAVVRSLAYQNGLRITRPDIMDNLRVIAEQNSYSPVQDYLKACHNVYQDNGANPIHDMFSAFHLDETKAQDSDFCELLFRHWLIGCARIAFNQGHDAMQGVLILQGPQGIGKSRFLHYLLPCDEWGATGLKLDPTQKDDIVRVIGLWIAELGEFGETLKKERLDALKQYITQENDLIRKPYARTMERTPRTTAFYGTVNDVQFLKDSTGERRYWVIALRDIDLEALSDFKEKRLIELWGYVMHIAFDVKERHYLTYEERQKLEINNRVFKKVTEEERLLLDSLEWSADTSTWKFYKTKDISSNIGLFGKRLGVLGRVLKSMQERDKRIKTKSDGHGGIKYLLPPRADDDNELDSMF